MRFHVGMSFRPKQLIKWILPILIALGLFSLSDLKLVKAESQEDVRFNSVDNFTNTMYCGESMSSLINYWKQFENDKYNLIISQSSSGYTFRFLKKNISMRYNVGYLDSSPNNYYYFWEIEPYENSYGFTITLLTTWNSCPNGTYIGDTDFSNHIEDYLSNTTFTSSMVSTLKSYIDSKSYPLSMANTIYGALSGEFQNTPPNLSSYFIYSSVPFHYDSSYSFSGFTYPILYIDNYLIEDGDDYIPISPSVNPIDYKNHTEINSIYVYDSVSDLSNFNLEFSFVPEDSLYGTAIYPAIFNFYGLVTDTSHSGHPINHFEQIDASVCNYHYSYSTSGDNKTLTFNNISCPNGTFNNYSFVSFEIAFVYSNFNDREVSRFINPNYNLTSTALNTFINEKQFGINAQVYFPLNNGNVLNSSRRIFVSPGVDYPETLYVISNSKYLELQPYNLDKLELINNNYVETMWENNVIYNSYGFTMNRGYLIANNPNRSSTYTALLFLGSNGYVSLTSDDTICYNSQNGIVCNTYTMNFYLGDPANNDNLDHYFSFVTNYIDSITYDMYQFSNIVQDVYDTMPNLLQSVFSVLFILGNIFILLKLIRK